MTNYYSLRFRHLPLFFVLLAGCASTIPHTWMSMPEAKKLGAVECAGAVGALESGGNAAALHIENNRIYNGEKPITEAFAAIDSFALSESRGEVAFSARRASGFDIGLAASDGSKTNWVPADPADEVSVQWAPRGNKISYIVRAPLGDMIRTLHVPTSFQFVVDFGSADIHALVWEPQAEKYAVAYSTLDASDRVEVLKYDGTQRKIAIPPSMRIDEELAAFATEAMVLRPREIRYGEKLPVVVWVADRFGWNDARAALANSHRAAIIVTKHVPDDALRQRIAETDWMDPQRIYVVGAVSENAISIVGDANVPAGRFHREGNVVSVAPAAIQSFAAGFIADHLKRNPPTNGSSR